MPETIKILSWWGYFSHGGKLAELERHCNAKIEVTDYRMIEDLLALAAGSPYDIYVYPFGYHDELQAFLPDEGPDLSDLPRDYHLAIRGRYQKVGLPNHTVLFQEAVTAFIYDPEVLSGVDAFQVDDIFRAMSQGRVVLQDEIKQIDWLFRKDSPYTVESYWDQLYHAFDTQKVKFSNFGPAFCKSDLVLGYLDSGEAHNPNLPWQQQKNRRFDGPKQIAFSVHPRLSHLSADLLSVRGSNPAAECVGRVIGGRDFLNWVTQDSFYFSPYGDVPETATGSPLSSIAEGYLSYADKLEWLDIGTRKLPPGEHAHKVWDRIMTCRRTRGCTNIDS